MQQLNQFGELRTQMEFIKLRIKKIPYCYSQYGDDYPPVSEVSKEVANLTERKNLHTPVYGVKELSVCLWSTLTPSISGLAEQNGQKKVCMFGCQNCFVSLFILQKQLFYDFLAGNNYPYLPHSQGDMKFAT